LFSLNRILFRHVSLYNNNNHKITNGQTFLLYGTCNREVRLTFLLLLVLCCVPFIGTVVVSIREVRLTFLLLLVLCCVPFIGTVVVSTITSGSTIISCDEYCVGSSDMVVKEISDGIRGYRRLLLLVDLGADFFFGLGEGSGEGVGSLSPSSKGLTCINRTLLI
jgi:hypothetical protein